MIISSLQAEAVLGLLACGAVSFRKSSEGTLEIDLNSLPRELNAKLLVNPAKDDSRIELDRLALEEVSAEVSGYLREIINESLAIALRWSGQGSVETSEPTPDPD